MGFNKILLVFLMVAICHVAIHEGMEVRVAPKDERIAKLEAQVKILISRQEVLMRGRDGRDGMPGAAGRDGTNGKDGQKGSPELTSSITSKRRDGRDGQVGRQGPLGPPGPKGLQGIQGPTGPRGIKGGGLQYIRYGKTTCQGDAKLVYKGRVASGHYSHKGSGVNWLCVTEQPKFLKTKAGSQGASYIYGTEYETNLYGTLLFGKNLHDHEVPCAVCFVETRTAKMMHPGTYECPSGWTREYYGYLMTGHHNHQHPNDFVCVDHQADPVSGSQANLNGALLYNVEAHCGALPCPPYTQGYEFTCAICTH